MVSIGRRGVGVVPLQLAKQHRFPAAKHFHVIIHMKSNSLGIVLVKAPAFAYSWSATPNVRVFKTPTSVQLIVCLVHDDT